ncbi:MAG: FAD-binding protein [Pyrinomonadaceae bacterium]
MCVQPQLLVDPGDGAEAGRVLLAAKELGCCVIPRGGGTKMDWGNVPRAADVVLSTVRLNRVVEHAWGDMTATVEAGCTIAHLQETLARHKQRLPSMRSGHSARPLEACWRQTTAARCAYGSARCATL